jgi:predicted MFS family arabinose efflux permease
LSVTSAVRDPKTIPGYRWYLLSGVMLGGWAINWYGWAIGIALPRISNDLGLSPSQEGWLGSSFFLAGFLFTIPLTNLFSRVPPVKLMSITLVVCSGLLFLSAYLPNYPAQVLLRFLIAALFVAVNPARTLLTQTWFREDEYAHATGVFNSMYGLIESVAFWTTAPLLALFGGWQVLFYFFGVFSAVSTILWILLARDQPRRDSLQTKEEHPAGTGSPLKVIWRREPWLIGFAGIGGGLAWASFITFWPTVAQEQFGMSETASGFVLGFTSIGIIPGSLASAWLLRKVGRRTVVIAIGALLQAPTFGLLLVSDSVPFLIGVALLNGLTWTYFPLIMAAPFHIRGISPREVAVATAFVTVLNQAGVTIGPALSGILAEFWDLRFVLFLMSLAPLLTALGGLMMGEAEPEPKAVEVLAAGPVAAG